MHQMRAALSESGPGDLLAKRARKAKSADGGAEPSLAGLAIPRTEARTGNQRREDRHLNLAERAEIRFRGRHHDVSVANVSRHGAMIVSDIDPRIGERLQIRFDDCNRTECAVRWLRGGRIGLEFARETEIIGPAAVRELIVSGRREGEREAVSENGIPDRPPRHSLLWKAVLHWDHGTFPVRIRNISAEGAMLEGTSALDPGTGIVLDLGEAGAASGTVRWSRGGQIGLLFEQSFDLHRLVRREAPHEAAPAVVKPRYLESEGDPDSPWAAAWDKFTPDDLDAAE